MRSVLYARVSSEKQAEKDLSIPAQLKALRKYAIKRGWDVVREFIDEAESARTANRPAFQDMIALAKQKESPFEAILVWKLSRFARNREDAVLYKALLRKKGIQVISINEQIDESPSGKLLEGIIEVIDEFYSANLAQDTRRGMRENVARGYLNGGRMPYGYQAATVQVNGTAKHKLAINELEAPIVRQVFRWCLEGEGAKEIAKRLNTDAKRTRIGNPWSRTTIYYMLTNPVYTGTLIWNWFRLGRDLRNGRAKEEVLKVPNAHPALIPTEDFERVQHLLAQRSPKVIHPRSVASPHLLSGLLFCVRCGSKMIAIGAKSGRFTYYTCLKYWRQGRMVCEAKMLNTRKLEALIVQVIKERILTDEHLTKLVRLIAQELTAYQAGATEKLALLDKQIADTERRLGRLYQLIEGERVSFDQLAPRLRELTSLKEQQRTERETLQQGMHQEAIPCPSRDEVQRYVEDLRQTLEQGSLVERKGFLRSFIKRIEVNHPDAEIEYTVPLVPPNGREAVKREVLSIGRNGWPSSETSERGVKAKRPESYC